jgi:DNA-binding response OmpR family regulator
VPQKTILIAEDESDIREAYHSALSAAGYTIFDAANGLEALALVEKSTPDLIILDLQMPELDGLETLRELRESSWGKSVPVMVLTNSADLQNVVASMKSLAADYFIKAETSLETLITAVKDLIGESDNSGTHDAE